MMLTLELKAQFEALATRDHVLRIQVLLAELDVGQQYSACADFPDVIRQWVDDLGMRGIHSAYQQACVIFSAMAGNVDVESMPQGVDAQLLVAQCVSKALRASVPNGAFQHIHRVFSGVGVFNEAWIHPEVEPDCLNNLPPSLANFTSIDLPCLHEGPAKCASLDAIHNQATFLRTVSGFQHKVSALFPFSRLLSQVCQGALSSDPWCVSPHPVFEYCEIGMGAAHCFAPVQKVRLVDARQASMDCQQRGLELPDSASQGVESNWKNSSILREATLHLQAPVVQADLSFSAGWESKEGGFVYATHGDLRVSLSADGIQWQGSLIHEGCLVQLSISLPRDFHMDWSLASEFPEGQLPLGVPLLTRQQNIPLHIQLNSAICVGKSVLNLANPIAGHLSLHLVANVDPKTRCLGLTLELGHSQLACEWQGVDALLGWTSGKWCLLPESPIHAWNLNHG